jgi:hypothetical protein
MSDERPPLLPTGSSWRGGTPNVPPPPSDEGKGPAAYFLEVADALDVVFFTISFLSFIVGLIYLLVRP